MYVKNKEMYHFHKSNEYDDLWKEGNEIIVDDNFNTDFFEIGMSQPFAIKKDDGYYYQLDYCIDEFLEDIDKKSKTDIIDFLKIQKMVFHEMALRDRELLIEECRRLYYPDRISRNHAIYLCDEKSLDFWKSQLTQATDLFKVSVTGELFKSNSLLIPNKAYSGEILIDKAKEYWKANLNDLDDRQNEYLFQGKVKILKKLNN